MTDPYRYTKFEIPYLFFAWPTLFVLVFFIALMWIKRRVNIDRWWLKPWLWPLLPFVAAFLLLDAVYHVTIGTLLFLERPRPWLFTDRLQDLYKRGDDRILRFVHVLEEHDPKHVSGGYNEPIRKQ